MQEVHLTGRLTYGKVLGEKNPSDILTKHVPAGLLARHLETVGAELRGGRPDTAAELNTLESEVHWLEPLRDKIVRFHPQASMRAIPQCNRGKPYRSQAKTRVKRARTAERK